VLDLSRANDSVLTELSRLVPSYEDLVVNAKIHLLQSIVSRILVEVIFDAYFVGLSAEQSREFSQMEKFLSSFSKFIRDIPTTTASNKTGSSPEPINQWRSSTLAILKKESSSKLQSETALLTETIISRVNTILGSITDAVPSPTRDQGLQTLITNSIELSRLLVVQKAVFKVFMPEIQPYQKIMFDSATMEDIGGEELDEDGLAGREICCVTFPGIVKRGDENGGQLQYRNVIAKARVLCCPE
jgi:activating signal cointegrator complex subunit 1